MMRVLEAVENRDAREVRQRKKRRFDLTCELIGSTHVRIAILRKNNNFSSPSSKG